MSSNCKVGVAIIGLSGRVVPGTTLPADFLFLVNAVVTL